MATWQEIREIFTWLPESSDGWHQHKNGGGWVSNNSDVSDDSIVVDNSVIDGSIVVNGSVVDDSIVVDNSVIDGSVVNNSIVDGSRIVSGVIDGSRVDNVTITRTPIRIAGTRYPIGYVGDGNIQSGCVTKPIAWWLEHVERCAQEYDYTADQQREYRQHVESIVAWLKIYEPEVVQGIEPQAAKEMRGR